MELTPAEVDILLQALNGREGVLSTDWEAAARANSTSLLMSLCEQLRAVRLLADKLAPSSTLQS